MRKLSESAGWIERSENTKFLDGIFQTNTQSLFGSSWTYPGSVTESGECAVNCEIEEVLECDTDTRADAQRHCQVLIDPDNQRFSVSIHVHVHCSPDKMFHHVGF